MSTSTPLALSDANLRGIHQQMKAIGGAIRLPLHAGRWSGVSGSVLGQGAGSSIDFHDQRPYHPGDDPRHINWQAYARSGSYTMKLYRQEVTPRVDLVFDATASMFLTESKARRSWELLFFCAESALRYGASLTLQVLAADKLFTYPVERLLAYDVSSWLNENEPAQSGKVAASLSSALFRAGSLRVLISDGLYEEEPANLLSPLIRERGRGVILAPSCKEESNPDWNGNLEFVTCETSVKDRRRVEPEILERYLKAYQRHFALWQEECQRRAIAFAQIPAEGDFLKVLRTAALPTGAVEMTA